MNKRQKKKIERKNEGAFVREVRLTINEDFKLKKRIIKDMIANPDKYPTLTGQQAMEFLFGDYQVFADKFDRALNGKRGGE